MTSTLEKLSTKKMKEIITIAANKLINEEKFNIEFTPLTITEYYLSNTFKKKLKLQKENNNSNYHQLY